MKRWWLKRAGHVYRLLLAMCPRDLREDGGAAALFDVLLADETERSGWRGFTRFCLGAYADALLTAAFRVGGIVGSRPAPTARRAPDRGTTHGEGGVTMSMAALIADVRMGFRTLARTRAATVIAVGTVAVAIALTTLTVSAVYGALLRPLPFEGSDRVMAISWVGADFEAPDFRYLRERQTAFESVEGYSRVRATISGMGEYAESVQAGLVTATALTHLGVVPEVGQMFPAAEGVTQPVEHVMLGYDLWRTRFGGGTDVLGRSLRVDGRDLEILGVMPEGFAFPVAEEMWVPLDVSGTGRSFSAFGRLRLDRSQELAEAEAGAIAREFQSEFPQQNAWQGATVVPFALQHLPRGMDTLLYVMLAAVGGVLLIASSNLAHLLLARSAIRGREVAIRGALGASRGRILQQFLVEALVLSATGTALGVGLALLAMGALNDAIIDIRLPYWIEFGADGTVLLVTIGLMASIALAAGTLPAVRAMRRSARPLIDSGGRGSSPGRIGRVGSALITAQIALSLGLLVGAGLLIESVVSLRSLDPGFDAEHVLTARLSLPSTMHPDAGLFFQTLVDELEALPSVDQAAVARSAPGTGATFAWNVWVEGQEYGAATVPSADGKNIGRGYFEAMGLDLVEGRDFAPEESRFVSGRAPPTAVIVNRTFAQRHLGPVRIGRRVQFGTYDADAPWFTVVGVVEDGYVGSRSGGIGLHAGVEEQMYIPWGLVPYRDAALLVRTHGQPEGSLPEVRALVSELAPGVPLVEPAQLSRRIEETTWAFGLFARIFTAFGGTALLMAVVGLYGVIAFNVGQRRKEWGTRIALGATPVGIVRLSMREGAIQTGVGLAIGSLLGVLLADALQAVIFQVGAWDRSVYLAATVVVGVAALTASLAPALNASRLDPQTALRLD